MYNTTMAQPLPYPVDRFTAQFIQVQPGNAPFLPRLQFMPPPLEQYYPLVVTEAMDALQAKAQLNYLRVFLFNQMSDNGWNNPEFVGFLQGLVELVDFKLATRAMNDPLQCIRAMAITYAEIQAAQNTLRFPALFQGMDRLMADAVAEMNRQAQVVGQEIQMYQRRMSPQVQQVQQPMYGGGGMAPGGFAAGGGRGHGGVIDMRRAQLNTAGVGSTGGLFTPASTEPAGFDTGAPASSDNRWSRGRKQHSENVQEGRSAPLGSGGAVPFSNSPWSAVKKVEGTTGAVRMPTGDVPQQQPTRSVPVQGTVPASDPSSKWVPSVKAPVNLVFDPLATELFYRYNQEAGFLEPVVYKKDESQMDINQHVTSPSFVTTQPVGVEDLDTRVRQFELNKSLEDDKLVIEAPLEARLQVTYNDEPAQVDVSLENQWLRNETALALMKKMKARVNLHRSVAVSLVPLITGMDPKPMITAIAKSPSFEAATKVMKRFLAENVEQNANVQKTLTFVNNRLTQRLNDFVRKNMALPTGTIDSFMEDAAALPAWIERKYSSAFSAVLVENQAAFLQNALEFTDDGFTGLQNTNLFPEDKLEEIGKILTITYFCDYMTLSNLDLFSTELRFDFPKNNKVACGVFAAKTPLLHQIAENTLTHARTFDNAFYRHLVRTADGITLEILPSATTKDFILVCPENL